MRQGVLRVGHCFAESRDNECRDKGITRTFAVHLHACVATSKTLIWFSEHGMNIEARCSHQVEAMLMEGRGRVIGWRSTGGQFGNTRT